VAEKVRDILACSTHRLRRHPRHHPIKPPTSCFPCCRPKIYCRAESLKVQLFVD
jgi:hypothetical protein